MSEGLPTHKSHTKEYLIVFALLGILTVAEIMVAEHSNYLFKASSLIVLATGKAFMVAYFYMHLKEETKWTKIIAAVPLAAVAYAVVVILETMFR